MQHPALPRGARSCALLWEISRAVYLGFPLRPTRHQDVPVGEAILLKERAMAKVRKPFTDVKAGHRKVKLKGGVMKNAPVKPYRRKLKAK
jgi:hypothetical protein